MKQKLLTLLLAIFVSNYILLADDSGTCGDNLQWSYNSTTHALTIIGSGKMTDWSWNSLVPWKSYKAEIASVNLPNGLTSIGNNAFYECSALTSVTIPNSVTSIGENAFLGCSSLANVIIPNSVKSVGSLAFLDCTALSSVNINDISSWCNINFTDLASNPLFYAHNLYLNDNIVTNLVIPEHFTNIRNYTFSGCSSLTSITIPNSVISIGQYAFSNCTGLTSITIPNSVTSIGNSAFYNVASIVYNGTASGSPWGARCVNGYLDGYLVYGDESKTQLLSCLPNAIGTIIIPNRVTSIGIYAFYNCKGVINISIGDGVTCISSYAFKDCSDLTSISIGRNVTEICDSVFSGCTGLKNVVWNVESSSSNSNFSNNLFKNIREQITSFTFGNRVQAIPAYFCYGMNNLTNITISNSVTSIGDYAFSGCCSLTNIIIPDSVTSIGDEAFSNCQGLTSVTIGNGLRELGNILDQESYYGYDYARGGVFRNCENLTNVYIPEGVTCIGNSAFQGCSSLTSINIPNSISSIGLYAFANCSSLTSVSIPENVNMLGSAAFNNCYSLKQVNWNPRGCTILNTESYVNSVWFMNSEAEDYYSSPFENCSQIVTFNFGANVREIPAYLFKDATWLSNISLPNGVSYININAFSGCANLTSVTFPNTLRSIGENAFMGCTGLTQINLQDSVVSIGKKAFEDCTSLTSIVLPDCVTRIGDYAFSGCTSLTSFVVPDSVINIGAGVFTDCYSMADVTWNAINYFDDFYAFPLFQEISSQITSFTFGDNVRKISSYLCYGMDNLTSITIPGSVTHIGNCAFSGCKELTNIVIPESVTSIGNYAFSYCQNLINVSISENVTNIGVGAFSDCSSLTNIIIPENITNIEDNVFKNCISLTSVIIPDGVTSVGDYSFAGCIGLSSMTLHNNITRLGNYSFYGCIDLTAFNIPNSVTSIGEGAFSGCTYLQKVILGNGLTSIDNSAFANCTYLAEVTANMQFPPIIDASVFTGCGDLSEIPCFVPNNSLIQYRKTNVWKSFKLIGVEEAGVSTEETSATITAPFSTGNVASYSLTLYHQGEVFCTLTLNSNGQLVGIDFAHSPHRVVAFATSVNGLNIPITGLQPGTTYTYTLDALDSYGNIIDRHAGEFTTEGTTALENVNADGASGVRKVIEDGKVVIIIPDGRKFDASGRKMR